MFKRQLAVVASALVLTAMMTACSTVEETEAKIELSKISVLAVDNNIQIKPSDTFSWNKDVVLIGAENLPANNIAAAITSDIEKTIQANGHTFIDADKHKSTFNLTAMAILDKPGDNNLIVHFGLDPGMGASAMNNDKGSLVLAVKDGNGRLLWRGVVQIYTDKDMDEAAKEQRRQRAIASLLKELFSKKLAAVPVA